MSSKPDTASRGPLLVATGLGLGYLPIAPGTWGSLGSLGLYVLLHASIPQLGFYLGGTNEWKMGSDPFLLAHGAVAATLAVAGLWAIRRVAGHFDSSDPAPVVIDEMCGQQIVFLGFATLDWKYLLSGFLLFRAFDIWKPFPARRAEAWPGAWGIMADDWIAGLYAALVLRLAILLKL